MKLVHTVPETCTDTYDQNCAVWLVGCVWKFLVPTCTELCYIRCKFLIQLYKLLVQVSWAGVISIRLGMKFNIIQVNTHRMTESDIRFDVTLSCNDLYMSAHAAPARRLYSSIRQFLIHSTFVLVCVRQDSRWSRLSTFFPWDCFPWPLCQIRPFKTSSTRCLSVSMSLCPWHTIQFLAPVFSTGLRTICDYKMNFLSPKINASIKVTLYPVTGRSIKISIYELCLSKYFCVVFVSTFLAWNRTVF